jgi:hypothetical protein
MRKSLVIIINSLDLVSPLSIEKHPQSIFIPLSKFIEMANTNISSSDESIRAELLMKTPISRNKPQKNSIQGKILDAKLTRKSGKILY